MKKYFASFSTWVSDFLGTPTAFLWAILLIIIWAVLGPFMAFSTTWQLYINTPTTILTFLFLFCLQYTQTKNSKAVQTKLDEIIHSLDNADNKLIGIENRPD